MLSSSHLIILCLVSVYTYICWSLCAVLMVEGPPKLMSVVLMSLDDGMFGLSLQYDVKVLIHTYIILIISLLLYLLYLCTYTYIYMTCVVEGSEHGIHTACINWVECSSG